MVVFRVYVFVGVGLKGSCVRVNGYNLIMLWDAKLKLKYCCMLNDIIIG